MRALTLPRLVLPRTRAPVVLAAAVLVAGSLAARSTTSPPNAESPAGATSPSRAAPALAAPGAVAGPDTLADVYPAELDTIDRSISIWTGNLRRDAKDFLAATNLASLYGARARLTGDVDDYERALDAAKAGVAAAPAYAPARLAQTTALLALHEFGAALSLATEIRREDGSQLGALAAIGDASQELGDYRAAGAAFTELASRTGGAAVDARLARFDYLTGDDLSARRLALAARDAGTSAEADAVDPLSAVFYHYQLAELARLTGDSALAGHEYEAALAIRATDLGSLVGLARVDASSGDTATAIRLLRRATAIAPQPEALGLLGDVLATSGDTAGATRVEAEVRQIRRLSELEASVFDRQLLLFELDHGGATEGVLAEARTALAARHDVYGHDVVAWALYRLGRYDEAATESAAARSTGIVDARILYHAGAIAIARGDLTGRVLAERALALGPALDPIERSAAEALVR